MKMSIPTARILAGMGLAAGLFLGCQNILDQSAGAAAASSAPSTVTADQSALRLSIKDDSTCRDEWGAILAARTAGHADSASEAGFLSSCVNEVKATAKGVPLIPPDLVPDSNTRCHWIVSQIDGGRDSMTVSYNRYCADDCRKLETEDSTRHEQLCHEPGNDLGKGPGKDTLAGPGKPPRHDSDNDTALRPTHPVIAGDTCFLLRAKLDSVEPGAPGRADLEHSFAARCHEPLPKDTLPKPPRRDSGEDTSMVPPAQHDSVCADMKLRLGASAAGSADRGDLEKQFRDKCLEPKPPVIPPAVFDCGELRKRLAALDPASADYARIKEALGDHCSENASATP